jgi:alpha-1,2-mannosyltransferase
VISGGRRDRALVAALLLGALTTCVLAAVGLRHLIDVGVYLHGGDAVLSGESPYVELARGTDLPFTYPPIAAVLFAPLAALPQWLAVGLWLVILMAAAGVSFALLLRRTAPASTTPLVVIGVAAAAFLTEPFFATFGYGQINTVLLAAVLVDAELVRRGSRYGGLLTGLAAAVKLTPAIFLTYFLITGRRRAAGRGIVAAAIGTLLPVLLAPSWAPSYWTSGVTDPGRVGEVRGEGNQSLLGMVSRWWVDLDDSVALRVALLVAATTVGLLLARRCWAAGRDDVGLGVVAVAGLLASPVSWDHHYVWLAPLLVAMLAPTAPEAWRRAGILAIAVLLVCPPRRLSWDPADGVAAGWWQGLALSAYVIVAVLLLVTVARSAMQVQHGVAARQVSRMPSR